MVSLIRRSAAVVPLLVLAACGSSTKLTETWRAPEGTARSFSKVMVMVISQDDAMRRAAEDQLVAQMPPGRAAQSYKTFPASIPDRETAGNALRQEGFDGALTMRLVDQHNEVNWNRETYADVETNFQDYTHYAWPNAVNPGSLRADTVVKLETKVYSIRENKLIWSGVSETVNPEGLPQLLTDVIRAVGSKLRETGVVR
jgi:hypothetical protein